MEDQRLGTGVIAGGMRANRSSIFVSTRVVETTNGSNPVPQFADNRR